MPIYSSRLCSTVIFAALVTAVATGALVPALAQCTCLSGNQTFPVGDVPRCVAVSDLDGDGDVDMAVANDATNDVSVLLNNGNGVFARQVRYAAGMRPQSVAIGNLDGVGYLDVAVANLDSNDITVLLNQGSGVFVTSTPYNAGLRPHAVAIGDLNRDGVDDMVVANDGYNGVSVLLNRGNGTFASQAQYVVGLHPQLAIGDLNGDGSPDLAVTHDFGRISVLLNQGDGSLVAQVPSYATETGPISVAIADLDADGSLDLAVATSSNGGGVSVLLNQGGGTFSPYVPYDAGRAPWYLTAGDLNGDGNPDLAVVNNESGDLSVLCNQGNGTFATQPPHGTINQPHAVAIADLDGDVDLDVAVVEFGLDRIAVFLNCTRGAFPFCFGNGTNVDCPCSNNSAPGQAAGCLNSFGGGARLSVLQGSPQSSPVVFGCTSLPPNALCVLMRTAQIAATPFSVGDGLKCLVESQFVFAVQSHVAVAGATTFNFWNAPSGQTRYFQVMYRDANLGFCTASTLNFSNGLALSW